MHLVVDSNQLQQPALRQFLERSKSNRAVLTDFVGMEAYRGDPKSMFRWMDVLADFPKQVIVLKGTRKACGSSGRASGLQRRLIDEDQTRHFPEYVRAVQKLKAGDARLEKQIASLRADAVSHLAQMEADASVMRPAIDTLGNMYSKEERAIIRAREPYTSQMVQTLTRNLLEIAARVLNGLYPNAKRIPFDQVCNTFPFRFSVAIYVLVIRRVADGGVASMSPARLRNDFVDMMFAAYATYFDGVMTADQNLNDVFIEVCILLTGLFRVELAATRHLRKSGAN